MPAASHSAGLFIDAAWLCVCVNVCHAPRTDVSARRGAIKAPCVRVCVCASLPARARVFVCVCAPARSGKQGEAGNWEGGWRGYERNSTEADRRKRTRGGRGEGKEEEEERARGEEEEEAGGDLSCAALRAATASPSSQISLV